MTEKGLFTQADNGSEKGMSGRTLALLVGGVSAVLGTYALAGQTGHTTPIQMPAGARQVPWLRSELEAFLIDKNTVPEAKCGHQVTFLKNFYDDRPSRQIDIMTVSQYEHTLDSKAPGKLSPGLRAELSAEASQKRVVDCPSAPSISYLHGTFKTPIPTSGR